MGSGLVIFTVFFAAFTQGLVGFGFSLIGMPILSELIGIREAAPLIALGGGVVVVLILAKYRQEFNLRSVGKLALGSLFGIPVGIYGIQVIDEQITRKILGIVIGGYGIYSLMKFQLPRFKRTFWVYLMGFMSGILGGAYNTSGPPVIIYGHSRGWQPKKFIANLQGYFLVVTGIIIVSHILAQNITTEVIQSFWVILTPTLAGIWLGSRLGDSVSPEMFRKLVMILLILIGFRLAY